MSNWTTILRPQSGWFDLNLGEIWRYRSLILLFVRRDFVAIYKQTILGPIWFLIQPLFSTVVFTIIFGKVAKIPTDGIPHVLFYLSGVICWNYFSASLTKTSDTFISNAGIFGKVYFPRLVVPVSVIITNLITFSIQMILFLCILGYYHFSTSGIKPGLYILFMPLLLLQMAALGLGVGIIISSLTTRYRDLSYLVSFGVQLWMYGTPIVYPLSQIPEQWKWIFILNPMASIVEFFRYAFLGSGSVSIANLAVSASITMVLLITGIVLFSRIEKTFMDTI